MSDICDDRIGLVGPVKEVGGPHTGQSCLLVQELNFGSLKVGNVVFVLQ
jgi:hypothetical protein